MTGSARPRLTAILTFRNAEPTLERCLQHLAGHGADIIAIDNGSTDNSLSIAKAFEGESVTEVLELPYRGYFDLSAQLEQKRKAIEQIGEGWIIHADADEFLDSPDDGPLAEYIKLWDNSQFAAFTGEEQMFLPTSDSEEHGSDDFPQTMRQCVNVSNRDTKQRLFRADEPLAHWLATGGHTVVRDKARIAPVPLPLRHYFGLSLDQIRSEYLARIFAPRDLGKGWHGHRRGAKLTVVEPDANILARNVAKSHTVPVFKSLDMPRGPERMPKPEPFDIQIAALSDRVNTVVLQRLGREFSGLRILSDSIPPTPNLPCLVIYEHPCHGADLSDVADYAENWLRFASSMRQAAIAGTLTLSELRIEDIEADPDLLLKSAMALLNDPGPNYRAAPTSPVHERSNYVGRLSRITRALAADLGYS